MNSKTSILTRRIAAATLTMVMLAAVLLASTVSSALADKAKPRKARVFPPHAKPYGKSHGEWAAAFWQWALAHPLEEHPFLYSVKDPYYDFGAAQSGKVWFWGAPDGPFTRKIFIPQGTALFVTIRDVEVSTLEEPPFFGANEQEQRELAVWFADHIVNVFCVIDGVPVENIEAYRAETPQFEFTAPTPWIFGTTGGTGTAVGDGYYVMVAPMSRGVHTIHYGGTYHFEPGELTEEALDLPHEGIIEVTVGCDDDREKRSRRD